MVAATTLATVPWSDGPTGLPRRTEQAPQGGWTLPEDVRLVPSPVHVRRDADGDLWVTHGAVRMVRCGRPGLIELPDDTGPMLDAAVVSERSYGLMDRVDEGARLRWYLDGAPAWERVGDFRKVLTDAGRVWTVERHGPAVDEWDVVTGEPVRTVRRSPDAGEPFVVDGRLYAVFTDFDAGQRGVETVEPDGTVRRTPFAGTEPYAWLVHPIGFDAAGRPYAVRDGSVARVAADGQVEVVGDVGDLSPRLLRVDPDGRVLFAVAGEAVAVRSLRLDG